MCLTDASRPDPWAAGVNARELMVSLWYLGTAFGGRRAPYMTPAESRLQLTSRGITGVPPGVLSTVRTSAVSDATPAGRPRAHPLVLLSPGFTNSRSTLTALAEDLASHGYVVAGIDHTYESFATAFPDGRVAGAIHASFTDLVLLADQIGIDTGRRAACSPVPGHHPRR